MVFLIAFEHLIPDNFDFTNFDIIESEFSPDCASFRNALMLLKCFTKEKHRDVYLCKTPMERISVEYPFIWDYKSTMKSGITDPSIYPSEIFENWLYLGSGNSAKNELVIQSLGITHILNVSDNVPNYFENDPHFKITYENINIEDQEDAPLHISFEQAFEFIENALFMGENDKLNKKHDICTFRNTQEFLEREVTQSHRNDFDIQTLRLDFENGKFEGWSTDELRHAGLHCDISVAEMHKVQPKNKLLVHCAMGRSRSAAIVTMFIMKKFNLPMKLAIKLLQSRREKVDINNGFLSQLEMFEEHHYKFATETQDYCSESTEDDDSPYIQIN